MTRDEFTNLVADYGEGCMDGSSLKWINEARGKIEDAFAALEAERDALQKDADRWEYRSTHTEAMWSAWQAARATVEPIAVPAPRQTYQD